MAALASLSGDAGDPVEKLEVSRKKSSQVNNNNNINTTGSTTSSSTLTSNSNIITREFSSELVIPLEDSESFNRVLPVIAGSALKATQGNFLLFAPETSSSSSKKKVSNKMAAAVAQEDDHQVVAGGEKSISDSVDLLVTHSDNINKELPNSSNTTKSIDKKLSSLSININSPVCPRNLEFEFERCSTTPQRKQGLNHSYSSLISNSTEFNSIKWEKIRPVTGDVLSRRGSFTSPIADYYGDEERDRCKTCHFMLVAPRWKSSDSSSEEREFLERLTEHKLTSACFSNLIGARHWRTKKKTLLRQSTGGTSSPPSSSLAVESPNFNFEKQNFIPSSSIVLDPELEESAQDIININARIQRLYLAFRRVFRRFLWALMTKTGVSEKIIGAWFKMDEWRDVIIEFLYKLLKFGLTIRSKKTSMFSDTTSNDRTTRTSMSMPSTLVFLFPATGEQTYFLNLPLAVSLAREKNYVVALLTAPFYGRRKPASQRLHYLRTVADFMKQNFGTQVEAGFLTRIFGGVMGEMQLEDRRAEEVARRMGQGRFSSEKIPRGDCCRRSIGSADSTKQAVTATKNSEETSSSLNNSRVPQNKIVVLINNYCPLP